MYVITRVCFKFTTPREEKSVRMRSFIADGKLSQDGAKRVDAIVSLFTLTWGVIFGEEALAAHGVFSRVFKCLSRYVGLTL